MKTPKIKDVLILVKKLTDKTEVKLANFMISIACFWWYPVQQDLF